MIDLIVNDLRTSIIRLRLFFIVGHKVEKMESRSEIVTKSQQSLLNKSNRIEIRFFLSSVFDKLDCTRFAHVNYQTPSLWGIKCKR